MFLPQNPSHDIGSQLSLSLSLCENDLVACERWGFNYSEMTEDYCFEYIKKNFLCSFVLCFLKRGQVNGKELARGVNMHGFCCWPLSI